MGLSSKPASLGQVPANRRYFGRTLGSPPGLPGGGITGVLPASGVGARISGIDARRRAQHAIGLRQLVAQRLGPLAGGRAFRRGTCPDAAAGCIGAQLVARAGAGGAVWAGGVAGAGGACALAAPAAAISTHERRVTCFIRMRENGRAARRFRAECASTLHGFAVADQREMPHRRHRPALGQGDAAMFGGPVGQPRPRKFRPPAEPPRQRRERQFEDAARAAFGADVIDQDEFAAGFQHADEIIQRALRDPAPR